MELSVSNIETKKQGEAVKKFLEAFSLHLSDAGYTNRVSGAYEITADFVSGAAFPAVVGAFRNSFHSLEDEELDAVFDSVPKIESDEPELAALLDGVLNSIVVVSESLDPVWDTIETLAGHIGESLEAIRQLQGYLNEYQDRQKELESAVKYLFSKQPNADYDSFFIQSELKKKGELQ